MSVAQLTAERYLATWNETDAARRTALLRAHWSESVRYVDPIAQAAGIAEIDALIGSVQRRFAGFRFALIGTADGHGDQLRFRWSLGPIGAEPPIEGSDVVLLEGDRIANVIGFLDKVPASA